MVYIQGDGLALMIFSPKTKPIEKLKPGVWKKVVGQQTKLD